MAGLHHSVGLRSIEFRVTSDENQGMILIFDTRNS